MAKPAPHLAQDDLAYDRNVPAHMLVRLFNTLEEDGIETPTIARGGHSRVTVIARLGPIHRDSKTVYVTVIFPSASSAGVVHQEHLHAQRVDCTSQQLERMLTGQEKIPSGLTPNLIKQAFGLLKDRERKLAKTQARFNAMAQRAQQMAPEDRPQVQVGPVFFHKGRGEFVQPFTFTNDPDGKSRLCLSAAEMWGMLRGHLDIPPGIEKHQIKGRLTVIEKQADKREDRHRKARAGGFPAFM
jgi:hypothetical protein